VAFHAGSCIRADGRVARRRYRRRPAGEACRLSTIIASLTLANVPAYAGGFDSNLAGGLIGGIAGGLIAGAIEAQGRPHFIYVVPRHRVYVTPRPRVIVVHAPPVVVQQPTLAPVVAVPVPVFAAPAPAPASGPIIINNAPAAPAPAAAAPVIIMNVPATAPPAAPAAVAAPTATAPVATLAESCQLDFPKTEDYLACLKGTPVEAVAK